MLYIIQLTSKINKLMEKILYYTYADWKSLPIEFKIGLQQAGWRSIVLEEKVDMPRKAKLLAGNIRIFFDEDNWNGIPLYIKLQSGEVIILPSTTFDAQVFNLSIWEHVFRRGFGKTLKDKVPSGWIKPPQK